MKKMERYAAYKETDPILGEIPELWQVLPLKRIAQVESSGIWGNDDPFPNSVAVKVPTTAAISADGHWLINKMSTRYLTAQEADYYKCQDGDIIVVKSSGSAANIISGKAGYVDRDNAGKFSFGNFLLRVRPITVDARLLYYFLTSNVTASRIEQMVSTTTYPNIKIPEYVSSLIPIPPLPEQTRIAHYLDRKTAQIDRAIAQKERLIELLRERQRIVTQRAVTKGLVEGVAMKDSGVAWLGEVPAGWEVKRIKQFTYVQTGITLGKRYSNATSKVSYLRVANVQAGFFDLGAILSLELPEGIIEKHELQVGDLLVTEGGDIDKLGRGAVWQGQVERCIHQNHIFALRSTNSSVTMDFVSTVFGSDYGRYYFTQTANKTTNLASTNSTKLGNFVIALPPKQEMNQILNYLKTATQKTTHAITLQTRQIERLREYRRVLIDGAVTGKLKIP